MLKPNARFNKITDISVDFLLNNGIKGIILDSDNTIIYLDEKMLDGVIDWCKMMKSQNIKICIASNSSSKKRVMRVAKLLDVPYVYFSCKPMLRGLRIAKKILNLDSDKLAEIGDQLFTDVIGANRMHMFSILTNPLEQEKDIFSKIKRKLEKRLLTR